VTCTKCAPGYFKSATSTEPCEPCPANTYRETSGATELGDCVACLAKSSTKGILGQGSWRSCVCNSGYYRIVANDASHACMDCPKGLTCDGTSNVRPVVGGSVWVADGAIYSLQSCPKGYYVFPAFDASAYASVDASNAATQECKPCGKVR
jgi:hypothetical protein